MIPPPLPPIPPISRRHWGSPVERERRNRILLAVYAYAYEFCAHSIVSDAEYDALARTINPSIRTGHDSLDNFFATRYSADTGMWIYRHPEFHKVADLYERHYFQ